MKHLDLKKLIVTAGLWLVGGCMYAHDAEVDGIFYNLNTSTGEAEVTYKGSNQYNNDYSGAISIPAQFTYNGVTYKVTGIGEYAFTSCEPESLTIPEGVTRISENAFYQCMLSSITLPESVTNIGAGAFCASSLTSISIPKGVTTIGDGAFTGCSKLTSVSMPEGVTSIGEGAFSYCSRLTSIIIPSGVTKEGNETFYWCSSLKDVTLPEKLTTIGDEAFYNCNLSSITLPEGVTTIGYGAFSSARLTSITFPEGLTSIGGYAFSSSEFEYIRLPKSLKTIGNSAFSGSKLKHVDSYIQEPPIFDECVYGTSGDSYVELTVPSGTRDAYIAAGWTEDIFKDGIVERVDYAEVTIGTAGYATLYVPVENVKIPENVMAYTGLIDTPWVTLREIENTIPAGTPVIVKGELGTYRFAYTDESGSEKPDATEDGMAYAYTGTAHWECLDGVYDPMNYHRVAEDKGTQRTKVQINTLSKKATLTLQGVKVGDVTLTDVVIGQLEYNLNETNMQYSLTLGSESAFSGGSFTYNGMTFDASNLYIGKAVFTSSGMDLSMTIYYGKEMTEAVNIVFSGVADGVAVEAIENDLKGTAEPLVADGTQYVLAEKDGVVGFYKATGTIPAGKAYIEYAGAGVKGFFFGDADGLTPLSISPEEEKAAVYDLSGRRVEKMQKGIYVINGKKVMK